MIVDSDAGSDMMPFRPKEIYGWVMPVIGQRKYNLRHQSFVDWQTMTLRCECVSCHCFACVDGFLVRLLIYRFTHFPHWR